MLRTVQATTMIAVALLGATAVLAQPVEHIRRVPLLANCSWVNIPSYLDWPTYSCQVLLCNRTDRPLPLPEAEGVDWRSTIRLRVQEEAGQAPANRNVIEWHHTDTPHRSRGGTVLEPMANSPAAENAAKAEERARYGANAPSDTIGCRQTFASVSRADGCPWPVGTYRVLASVDLPASVQKAAWLGELTGTSGPLTVGLGKTEELPIYVAQRIAEEARRAGLTEKQSAALGALYWRSVLEQDLHPYTADALGGLVLDLLFQGRYDAAQQVANEQLPRATELAKKGWPGPWPSNPSPDEEFLRVATWLVDYLPGVIAKARAARDPDFYVSRRPGSFTISVFERPEPDRPRPKLYPAHCGPYWSQPQRTAPLE